MFIYKFEKNKTERIQIYGYKKIVCLLGEYIKLPKEDKNIVRQKTTPKLIERIFP